MNVISDPELLWKGLAFALGTLALGWVSRASLRSRRAHGFYRFFAWEAILALFLLNVNTWFVDPLSWHQLIAWLLLIASLFLVIHGVALLKQIGRQNASRSDPALLGFEKTAELVTSGAYRFIRHPLYSSLLCLAWGIFFKNPSWPGGLLALAAAACLTATARVEEDENILTFGQAYRDYMRRTKMFIPYLF